MNTSDIKSMMQLPLVEIDEVFQQFKTEGWLYTSSFIQISKNFLKLYLPVAPYKVDFDILKNAYLDNIGFKDYEIFDEEIQLSEEDSMMEHIKKNRILKLKNAIKNENEFHKYICSLYVNIIREPKEELVATFLMVNEDLKEIDIRLTEIQKKLDKIHSENDTKRVQEEKPVLVYYYERNSKAREEIIRFLTTDVNDYILFNCLDRGIVSKILRTPPYKYRWNRDSYKPKFPSDLENKFGDLDVDEFEFLFNLYNSDKQIFYKLLERYISTKNINSQILERMDKHHLLYKRKAVISEALKTFEGGFKIMFTNAIPTIIEGILHDLCLIEGVNENDLISKGLNYKLDLLHGTLKQDLFYEYYAFRFRLLRNKIAHGELNSDIVDEVSDLFLLDLFHICRIVFNIKLKLNQKRYAIERIINNLLEPDYRDVFWYLLLDEVVIPPFYSLDESIKEVENIIISDEFWSCIEKEINSGSEIARHGIYKILKSIGKNRKSLQNKLSDFFKKVAVKEYDKNLAELYFRNLKEEYNSNYGTQL